MSISMSFSGLVPSRGAYLFSSSSTITDSGRRCPVASFCWNVSFSRAPTTNRCACSCSDWIATTVTFAAARSIRRLSPARTRCPTRAAAACIRRRNAETVDSWTRPVQARSGSPSSGSRNSSSASTRDGRSVMIRPAWPAGIGPCQRPSGSSRGSRNATAPGMPCDVDREPLQLLLDALADERQLVLRVVRVGEAELEQPEIDELARRPREDVDALEPSAGVGDQVAAASARRRPESHARERRRLHADRGPPLGRALGLGEQPIGLVQPQQVLALDVEHQHAQVRRALTDDRRRGRQHPQEEQRERRLRGDAGDACDRHVAALAAVEEVEIDVHRQRRRDQGRSASGRSIWSA